MVLKSIIKKAQGEYLSYYDLNYENRNGDIKVYEMISRNRNLEESSDLYSQSTQAVVLVVFDKTHERILINKEFRMAVNSEVYNFPAGLIEENETPEDAAKRELKEETGLDLIRIITVLPPTYSAMGISNEKTTCILCEAEGVLGGSPEPDEEITPIWFTKEEVKVLLNGDSEFLMAARTQGICYMWVNSI